MQQLLTGQTRLPDFSGCWDTKQFGECAAIRNQKVMPASAPPDTVVVELEHLGQNNGQLKGCSTTTASTSSKYRFRAGDVLFGRLRPYLRKFWCADRDGSCSTEIWPLAARPGVMIDGFLHKIIQTDAFIAAAGISYGTHMPRADWAIIRLVDVRVATRHRTNRHRLRPLRHGRRDCGARAAAGQDARAEAGDDAGAADQPDATHDRRRPLRHHRSLGLGNWPPINALV